MHYRQLGNTGLQVSVLGFGAATLGDEYGITDTGEINRAVGLSIDSGMNLFDVAPYYGRTLAETRLGAALEGRRQEVILATKCARYDVAGFDFSADRVTRSIDESLQRLKTDYLDIFHIHDIEFGDFHQIVEETVPALRKLQTAGKTRFIGITGLSLSMLREVAAQTGVDCVLSYCRYNLLNRDLDELLAPFARQAGIGLMSASPLHMKLLAGSGPPKWHPAPDDVRTAAQQVVEFCGSRGFETPIVALQFALAHPDIASTFVGISTQEEVRQNLRALEGAPDPDLMIRIDRIVAPVLGKIWPSGKSENHDPHVVGA